MKKVKAGRKKLSRQFAIMVFIVQVIMVAIIGVLVRMESINIYLSAKNDMISEMLKKEAKAMDLDNSNPSPSWCFDYWKAHYTEFYTDTDKYESEYDYSEEELDYFYNLSDELSGDEAEAKAFLNALSEEEQLDYAKFQFYNFMHLFGRKTDYYGYEGCSCFMPVDDGTYMILVDMNEDRDFLNDWIYIEKNSSSKDKMMTQLKKQIYSDNKSVDVEYIRMERVDQQGKKHKLYVGYVPIVYDGEIKAVITTSGDDIEYGD